MELQAGCSFAADGVIMLKHKHGVGLGVGKGECFLQNRCDGGKKSEKDALLLQQTRGCYSDLGLLLGTPTERWDTKGEVGHDLDRLVFANPESRS